MKDVLNSILKNSISPIVVKKNDKIIYTNKVGNIILEKLYDNNHSLKNLNTEKTIYINKKHYKIKEIYRKNDITAFQFVCLNNSNNHKFFKNILMDNISDGVIFTNEFGEIIEYNKASEEFEGLAKKNVLGRKSTEIYDVNETESEILQVVKNKEAILDINGKFKTCKGRNVMLVSNYFPVFNKEKFIGVCVVSTDYTKIQSLLDRTLELQTKIKENQLKNTDFTFDDIVGESDSIQKAIIEGKKASNMNSNILITGSTGTGKELFVQSIHSESKRSNSPFVPVNCAAIPNELIESLLFGSEKGAFTGADNKIGLIEQASNGTLYLDELDSMPLMSQAKLLRVIQEKKVRKIGGSKIKDVNCRFIASISEEPQKCIDNNTLRKDLFYRLAVITIIVPDLCEREGDIEILTNFFINKYKYIYKSKTKRVSEDLMNIFKEYSWPGNVRELQYVIESAISMDRDSVEIKRTHLPNYLNKKFGIFNKKRKIIEFKQNLTLNEILLKKEKEVVKEALCRSGGNITKASKKLGISRQNLHYRIRKLKI